MEPHAHKSKSHKKNPQHKNIINVLVNANELSGYQSPSGRIAYNKIVDKSNFGAFSDIITSIVPLDIVNDSSKNKSLPSIARVLKQDTKKTDVKIYPHYLFMNMTMDEYMDYEDEEDQENMTELLDSLDTLPVKTPMIGVVVQKSESMGAAHAIAFIAWKAQSSSSRTNKYKFAFYDPLAYKRGAKSYDYTDKAFISSRFEEKIEFIDLNKYCFTINEAGDFHCSQYIINAEYCYIYSVFFLSKWLEFGHHLHRASLRKAIKSTYVVDPSKLTRANTKESMTYRVVLMAFICKTFLSYLKSLGKRAQKYILNSSTNIKRIQDYLKKFKETYGTDLTEIMIVTLPFKG